MKTFAINAENVSKKYLIGNSSQNPTYKTLREIYFSTKLMIIYKKQLEFCKESQ